MSRSKIVLPGGTVAPAWLPPAKLISTSILPYVARMGRLVQYVRGNEQRLPAFRPDRVDQRGTFPRVAPEDDDRGSLLGEVLGHASAQYAVATRQDDDSLADIE